MCCETELAATDFAGCCTCSPTAMRRVLTKQEKAEKLKEYKKQLELEIAGVNEKIEEFEKEVR